MIKIDGAKIKELREDQGLTQLYMATAVEVTTDTISRWENKRYPRIKKENAEKLAEALGVGVDEILLPEEEEKEEQMPADVPPTPSASRTAPRQWKKLSVLFVLAAAVLLFGIFIFHRIFPLQGKPGAQVSAVRKMPSRTLPNSPFPVVIEVATSSQDSASIILKEMLPEGSRILQVSPAAGSSGSAQEVKWIHKLQKTTRFSYLVEIDGSTGREYFFNGALSTSKTEEDLKVQGMSAVILDRFHWADTDGDNTISDREILKVFDYYSDIEGFTLNIEFIEKMWLGSRYSWDSETNVISITP